MLPYIVFYITMFILSFKIKKGKYTVYDFFMLAIMIIFSAVRYGIGTDYISYEISYNYLTDNISLIQSRTGWGFSYLMYFLKYICNMDFQSIIIITSFLTNFLIYRFLKKNSDYPGRAILIYISLGFYTASFNMFRQMLAIAFALTGIESLKNKKILSMAFLFLLAFLIHSISIIIIIALVCSYLFLKKKLKLWPICTGAIIFILFYEQIYYMILSNINAFSIYETKEYLPGLGTYINILVYFILYGIFIHSMKNKYDHTDEKNIYFNITTIGMGLILLESRNYLFARIANTFLIYFTILIADAYEIYGFRKKRLESLIFYLCLFMYFIIYIISFDGVVPYKMFF